MEMMVRNDRNGRGRLASRCRRLLQSLRHWRPYALPIKSLRNLLTGVRFEIQVSTDPQSFLDSLCISDRRRLPSSSRRGQWKRRTHDAGNWQLLPSSRRHKPCRPALSANLGTQIRHTVERFLVKVLDEQNRQALHGDGFFTPQAQITKTSERGTAGPFPVRLSWVCLLACLFLQGSVDRLGPK